VRVIIGILELDLLWIINKELGFKARESLGSKLITLFTTSLEDVIICMMLICRFIKGLDAVCGGLIK